MKIQWVLLWASAKLSFKSEGASLMFDDYRKRLEGFGLKVECLTKLKGEGPAAGTLRVVCERSAPGIKRLSSTDLASVIEKSQVQGNSTLEIIIGPPNGFKSEELKALKPHMLWSFGDLTLPHELASVVACEQIYRAFSIIRRSPYHLGH